MDAVALPSKRIMIAAGALAALCLALIVAAAAPSNAMASHQPICDEYPDLPQCNHPQPPPPPPPGGEFCEEHPDNPRCEALGPGAGSGGGPSGSAGEGSLPFTGYPLSPLLLLLLALLIAGLTIRGYLAVRERLRSDGGAVGA